MYCSRWYIVREWYRCFIFSYCSCGASCNQNIYRKIAFKPFLNHTGTKNCQPCNVIWSKRERSGKIQINRVAYNTKLIVNINQRNPNSARWHREAVQTHIESTEIEIDTAAEIDNNEFCRLINKKRKPRKQEPTFEMNFNGHLYHVNLDWMNYLSNIQEPTFEMNFNGHLYQNPDNINLDWVNYFTDLYLPTTQFEFKSDYLHYCESDLQK